MLVSVPCRCVLANRSATLVLRQRVANLEALGGQHLLQRGDLPAAASAGRPALRYYPPAIRARALMHQVDKPSDGRSTRHRAQL